MYNQCFEVEKHGFGSRYSAWTCRHVLGHYFGLEHRKNIFEKPTVTCFCDVPNDVSHDWIYIQSSQLALFYPQIYQKVLYIILKERQIAIDNPKLFQNDGVGWKVGKGHVHCDICITYYCKPLMWVSTQQSTHTVVWCRL